MGHKVTQAWMVIGVDEDGDEALAYAMIPGQVPRPMITTDLAGRKSMWDAAHDLAKNTGAELRLVRCEFLYEEDVIPGKARAGSS
jgi:hypothetical protein